jgi:hypothetical protein
MMASRVKLLEWRPLADGSLLGFAKIQFSSGLIVAEIGIHRTGSKSWAAPPSRPWFKGTELILDEAGKLRWQPLLEFMNHGTRASWSRQCVAAVRAEHPELFLQEGAAA